MVENWTTCLKQLQYMINVTMKFLNTRACSKTVGGVRNTKLQFSNTATGHPKKEFHQMVSIFWAILEVMSHKKLEFKLVQDINKSNGARHARNLKKIC